MSEEKTDPPDVGFAFAYPDLDEAAAEQKRALLQHPIEPIVPSETSTVSQLLKSMQGMSIQARNLGRCYEVLEGLYADPDRPTVFLGLAGPLVAGGLRQVIREMIEHRLVDVVVSTGAILYQDIYQARGFQHYRGSPEADDGALRDLWIDRIYDTYVDEQGFGKTDTWLGLLADDMEPGVYSSRQYLDHVADQLDDEKSIVQTCRKYGVPMFAPAINDSSIGIGLTEHHHRCVKFGRKGVHIDSIQDNYELTQVVAQSPATSALYIAGGVPKNYINDSVVMSYIFDSNPEGHRYALQVTTAVVNDGGLSSSTLDEAKSWGKIKKDAKRAMAWVEPTVALPMLVTGALQDQLTRDRSRIDLTWNGEILEKLSHTQPS